MKYKIIKSTIILPLLCVLMCAVSPAQQNNGAAAQKWRIVHNERDGRPEAVSLSSDDSITVNGKEIRPEVLFQFTGGVGELEDNYGHIEIRTGDGQIRIPESTPTDSQIITVVTSISWQLTKGREFINTTNAFKAVWYKDSNTYGLHDTGISKAADNGSMLRDFFNITQDEDEKKFGRAFQSYKNFFLNDNFRGCKIYFEIGFYTNLRGKDEQIFFKFTPTDLPVDIHNELVRYINRRGRPPHEYEPKNKSQ